MQIESADVLQRYEKRHPKPSAGEVRLLPYSFAIAIGGAIAVVPLTSGFGWAAVLVMVAALAAAEGGARLWFRQELRDWEARFQSLSWQEIHDIVLQDFRGLVARYREQLLGDNAELRSRRRELERGLDEAKRSVAFWEEAVAAEPNDSSNRVQLRTAQELETKLTQALEALDRRRHRLQDFLAKCDAKAKRMEFSKEKLQESEKLTRLADRADEAISRADDTLDAIGQAFLAEAAEAFGLLGEVERLHLSRVAGELPVDSVEFVAERIIQTVEEEEYQLDSLMHAISATSEATETEDHT